jgi:hypothetical protein
MCCVIELLDVESVLLELYYRPLVIIYIAVVRGTKYGYHCWEFLGSIPLMHFITIKLCLVCAQY